LSAAAFAPSLAAFTPASTLSAAFPANYFAESAAAFAPSLTAFTPAATLSAAFPANYLAASPAAFAAASIYSLVYFAPASTLSAAFPANYLAASAALATPDATALPASDTAFPVELANYLAASAAPAIPFLAHAFNFSPAAAASLTPSTIPFFKSAISDLNLLTMFASHLHKSPLTKVPS